MPRVLIYGAGGGGERLLEEIRELAEPYEIVAFVDARIGGTEKKGIPVIFPEGIASQDYDIILVATQDNSVPGTLHEKYNVPWEKINHERYFKSAEVSVRVRALERFRELCNIYGIKGSMAEVGVFQGDFAKHINRLFPENKLYLYDTFEGFADRDIQKENEGSQVASYTHYANTGINLVLKKMTNLENVIIRKGVFPDTLTDDDKQEQYAFVSIDPDLYAPVLAGVEYFYPRMLPGGEIFVHDYFSAEDPGVERAVSEFMMSNKICISPLGDFRTLVISKPF